MGDEPGEAMDRPQERLGGRGGGRNRGRRGGGARGGGGGGGQDRDVLISKALSTLLRHQAVNAGVELDAEGFARLDHVVSGLLLGSGPP